MIYLIRHGETQWNKESRYQGLCDSPLTKKGQDQARFMGGLLARELEQFYGKRDTLFEAFVSPLGRAQQTAQLIAQNAPIKLTTAPMLREVSVGNWDGKLLSDILQDNPELKGATLFDLNFCSPDGDCYEEAYERAQLWLEEVTRLVQRDAPVIAITHGAFSRLIRGVYLNLAQETVLQLPTPQDGFFALSYGQLRYIQDE